jgi:hypothetical protein
MKARPKIEKPEAGETGGAKNERPSVRGARPLTRWDIISKVGEERRRSFDRARRRVRPTAADPG